MGTNSSQISSSDTNADMMPPKKEKKKEQENEQEKEQENEQGKEKKKERRQPSLKKKKVRYKMVVCGQTFGAHDQILEQIQTPGLNMEERNDEERCITILFCPVTSQPETNAEAAMRTVPGDDPVILVLMHYSQEPKKISPTGISRNFSNLVVEVHVFYHDRKNGLLRCEQNEIAIMQLKKELKMHRKSQRSGSNNVN